MEDQLQMETQSFDHQIDPHARIRNTRVFLLGGAGYAGMEILFRGFTHWTMFVAGGICFLLLFYLYTKNTEAPLWRFSLLGAMIITGIEFIVGCIVNLWLGWNVWNYASYHADLLGQVCPAFIGLWFLLCFPLAWLIRYLSCASWILCCNLNRKS